MTMDKAWVCMEEDLQNAVYKHMRDASLEQKCGIRGLNYSRYAPPKEGELKEYGEHIMSSTLSIVYLLIEVGVDGLQRVVYVGSAKSDSRFHARLTVHKKEKSFDKVYFTECPLDEMHPKEKKLIREHLPHYNKCSASKRGREILMGEIYRLSQRIINDSYNLANEIQFFVQIEEKNSELEVLNEELERKLGIEDSNEASCRTSTTSDALHKEE